jgi:hypothetical protein
VKREALSAVVIAVLVVAGCGSDKAQVHSQVAQQVRLTVAPRCSIDYRTLITANEAFWAMNMVYTQDQSDLVDEGFLREEIDDFQLVLDGDDYDVVAVGACAGFDPTVDTVAEPEDRAEDETSCAADLKTLQTAWEAYYAINGTPPTSQQDLVDAGLIRNLSEGFDLVGTEFVAVPGNCG